MQINNVLSSQADVTSAGKRAASAGTAAANSVASAATASTSSTSAMAEVMRNYDLTEMTPTQFSEMIQKLRDNGSLTDAEYSQLAQLRAAMESDGIASDQAINVLNYCSQKCQALQKQADALEKGSTTRASAEKSLATMQDCHSWVQKLQVVHQSPDSIGLNTTA